MWGDERKTLEHLASRRWQVKVNRMSFYGSTPTLHRIRGMMWNTFKGARGQHILFQFILSLADMLSGPNILPQRRYSADVRTNMYWLWAVFGNERILRHKRFCENMHFHIMQTHTHPYTHTQTFRYSQTHIFQCDLLWNQGGSRLISSWPALKTSLMPDLHVSLYNIWQRASGAIHQTSSSAFHPPHTECCAWSN